MDKTFMFLSIYIIKCIFWYYDVAGVINKDIPCCELRGDGLQCAVNGKVCGNRSEYIFWDGIHPTEIGMMTLATRAFNAQHPNDTYPFDINHLVQL